MRAEAGTPGREASWPGPPAPGMILRGADAVAASLEAPYKVECKEESKSKEKV